MLEFEDLVYLDVQKTGSTYIKGFLRKFVRTEEIDYHRHAPVVRRNPGSVYVISCRDPLRYYLSLYSFGCVGKGGFAQRLERKNLGHFYDGTTAGFTGWLGLILDAGRSQEFLSNMDKHRILDFVGLQTLRFLSLALPSPRSVFDRLTDREETLAALHREGLLDVVVRTESLVQDLTQLVRGDFGDRFKDVAAAEAFLTQDVKKNRSPKFKIDLTAVPRDMLELMQTREWLFFESLGYAPYF